MKTRLGLIIVATIVILLASLPAPLQAQDPGTTEWPTQGWRSSTPEEQGMDSALLAAYWEKLQVGEPDAIGTAFIPYVPNTTSFIHSALVIRHGTVVMDASTYPTPTLNRMNSTRLPKL